MNRTLTREQKLLGAAGATVVFIISLFLPWFGAGGFDASGDDVIPSWWMMLLFAIAAAGLLAAEALNFELPARIRPLPLALYLVSVPTILTIMFFLDGGDGPVGRKFGLILALIASIAATALAVWVWREER